MLGSIISFVHQKYAFKGLTSERLSLLFGVFQSLLYCYYYLYLFSWCNTMLLTDVILIHHFLMLRWRRSYFISTFILVFWSSRSLFQFHLVLVCFCYNSNYAQKVFLVIQEWFMRCYLLVFRFYSLGSYMYTVGLDVDTSIFYAATMILQCLRY